MKQLQTIYIINHTHWDREWYETMETYRAKLKNGVRHLLAQLDSGAVENFFFDGQTIIVEDLQAVLTPTDFARFEAYLFAGKIEIGPWYVLGDGFLCDEETYMENLAIGSEIAKRYNQRVPIAYLPDTFGHIGQIPQIMRAHGIETALIHRGANSQTVETQWIGSEGSQLKTFVLPLNSGYYQTMFHEPEATFLQAIETYCQQTSQYQVADSIVILNGCDHTFLPHDFQHKMQQLKQAYPQATIKQVVMSEYLQAVIPNFQAGDTIVGEQQTPGKAYVLPGVWSTRTYLKQHNRQTFDTLTTQVEPILAVLRANTHNETHVQYLWKKALQNIPHDSICGCSIDEVHAEMEVRTQQVLSGSQRLIREELANANPFLFTQTELLANEAVTYYHEQVVPGDYSPVLEVIVPAATTPAKQIELWRNGQQLLSEIQSIKREERLFATHNQAPSYQLVDCYEISVTDTFAGRGLYTYQLQVCEHEANVAIAQTCTGIENSVYALTVESGCVSLLRKSDQQRFDDLFILKHQLDAGDTYNYSAPLANSHNYARVIAVEAVQCGNVQTLTLTYELQAPAQLAANRQGPSEQICTMPVTVVVEMKGESATLKVRIAYEQQFSDAKIQFGMPILQKKSIQSDTAFELVERQLCEVQLSKAQPQQESAWAQFPTIRNLYQPELGFQVTHDGLTEAEMCALPTQNYVFLTLVRAVGWLSRRDLNSRGGGAGPSYETPQAQCHRQMNQQLLISYEQPLFAANRYQQLLPAIVVQGTQQLEEMLLIASSNPAIHISRTKGSGNDLHVRMINPTTESQTTTLQIGTVCRTYTLAAKTFETLRVEQV